MNEGELPTAVAFVNTKTKNKRSTSNMESTINNREPTPSYSPFMYKSRTDFK